MVVPDVAATDDTLVACAATGDHRAFEALVARYQARVFRLACRLTSETDAADVVQDTFLQLYQHLASFRGDAQFSTWLYRIATNVCLMLHRSRARRPTEPLDAYLPRFDAHGVHAAAPDQLQIATRVEERLDRDRLAAAAKTALDRLPELYRTAFVLRDLEELSTADVAQVLGVEAATVRQRVHRARLMLRGYLNALGEERSWAR